MAEEEWFTYRGDRNRMPFYPALLSLAYDANWSTYFRRARVFAVVTSLLFLFVTAGALYVFLSPWPATALGLMAAFLVFLPKAAFVQAELLYYVLFFVSCALLVRLWRTPRWPLAIIAGIVCGFAYLAKASALPLIPIFCLAFLFMRKERRAAEIEVQSTSLGETLWRRLLSRVAVLLVLILGFLVVTAPVIATNMKRYGRPFYNVNSMYFMWCDSWEEAHEFETRYDLVNRRLDASADPVPGPLHYWQTHSLRDIGERFSYGLRTLATLAWKGPYLKYFGLACLLWLVVNLRRLRRLDNRRWRREGVWLFPVLTASAYLAVYAWYTPVAYGDRFLLSLLLPATAYLWWTAARRSSGTERADATSRYDIINRVAMWLIPLLLVEGTYAALVRCTRATPEFVNFYYNETVARLQSGDRAEAERGFLGIARLDETMGAPRKHLGMIALSHGAHRDAVTWLEQATRLDPGDADSWNSLGGAYLAAGDTGRAVGAFERAVELSPELPIAWYNLGGARAQSGDTAGARAALERLGNLDIALADRLEALIEDYSK